MKISVDKSMTTINALPQVKEDLREFKARYTDGDLLRAFMDATVETHRDEPDSAEDL